MKRSIVYIALSALLVLMTSSCMGVSGSAILSEGDSLSDELPSGEIRLTDVGNSEEGEELMKSYINPEFEVKATYSGSWDLIEHGTAKADFVSPKGENISATFMWLGEGSTFESFLFATRGDISDLDDIEETVFDRTYCAEADEAEDGMLIIECYHYYEFEKGDFVVSVGGFILPDSIGVDAEPFGMKVINEINEKSVAMGNKLVEKDVPTPCIGLNCAKPQFEGSVVEVERDSFKPVSAIRPVDIQVEYLRPEIKPVDAFVISE